MGGVLTPISPPLGYAPDVSNILYAENFGPVGLYLEIIFHCKTTPKSHDCDQISKLQTIMESFALDMYTSMC